MLENQTDNVPSIFDVVKNCFPPGTELIEVMTPDGRLYSESELKAIEWQENQMRIGEESKSDLKDVVARLEAALPKLNKRRTLKSLFKFPHGKIMVCNDDSVWFLAPEVGACFERCEADILPAVPQGD